MENSEKPKNLSEAARAINGELQAVLSILSASRGELMFPEAYTFPSGTFLASFPEKDVEKVVRDGVEKGEIYFAIDPNFSGQVFEVKRITHKDEEKGKGLIIAAFFPPDFIRRADIYGIRVTDALKRCLGRVLLEDVKIQAQKLERGHLKDDFSVGLVGIFRGKIT